MLLVKKINILQQQIQSWKKLGKRIALVPTMGNLHDGHLMMVKKAKKQADVVVVSIYINPMQFNSQDDFKNYPRTIENDCEKLKHFDIDLVFSPSNKSFYQNDIEKQTFVEVPELSFIMEGINRPKHFRGVSTVITKLFNLIQPNIAFFGEKDYQQLQLIYKLINDLSFNIKIIPVSTVRAKNGLALSSRNNNLSIDELKIAPKLYNILKEAKLKLTTLENKNEDIIINEIKNNLLISGFIPDGVFIRDADNLNQLNKKSKRAIILISAWLGKTRLIDNLIYLINTKNKSK
ncbi:Pantothenate synthetase [Candidatus Providencia siddallii]|uniref:Pantothenate synthetase n=1 Tax=Candidatus Providencia siddallii TaxID=1715285 RepID=A0A0M6W7X7_9GAMM|nr:Pantothenate synthetase [Candidatus Providencia siddallii]